MNINVLPDEVTTHIFSFLDQPKDQACASEVCKGWNENIERNIESMYQSLCLKFSENETPYNGSWKNRFKIIQQWHKGKEQITSQFSSQDIEADWTLVKDDQNFYTISSGCYDSNNRVHYYLEKHAKEGSDLIKIYSPAEGAYVAHCLSDKNWVVLDRNANIIIHDILNDNQKTITPQGLIKESLVNCIKARGEFSIKFNGKEITIIYRNEFIICNIETEEYIRIFLAAKNPINFMKQSTLMKVETTTNHQMILMRYSQTSFNFYEDTFYVYIINNKTKKCKRKFEVITTDSIASSGNHMAILSKCGEVFLYNDENPNKLIGNIFEQLKSLEDDFSGSACIKIHNNLLLASKMGRIGVWNIKTKECIRIIDAQKEFSFAQKELSFCTNGIQILTKGLIEDAPFRRTAQYQTIDFSLSPKPTKKENNTRCILQ